MNIVRLDHATINTADLTASVAFYGRYLGLKPGWRPPFDIGGAWLYPEDGSYPIVHLIARQESIAKGGMFDHVAFRSKDLKGYLARLKSSGDSYTVSPVPGTNLVQVQHYDPNQVLIEVNFENEPLDPAEMRLSEFIAGVRATTS
jgi:catechol 2,3-dioxygenase-like lactoylglutathione lyase family enzyme